MNNDAVRLVVDRVGGQTEMARRLGVTRQAVSKWIARGSIPAERVRDVMRFAPRGITRADLCPEVWG